MIKKIILFLVLLLFQKSFSQVTFIIEKPLEQNTTNTNIYISGDFEGWTGGQEKYKLNPIKNKHIITIISQNESINFKFTKGNWALVETDEMGNNIDNRTYKFKNKKDTVRVKISNWANNITKKSTATKNVVILTDHFEIPQLNRKRRVWIYFPPDYKTSKKSYPVLYMHDGQNLFDNSTSFSGEWEVDETLNQLSEEQNFELIVVGIDHGGEKRIAEYSPWKNEIYGGGEGDAYLEFIVETLKPYIDNNYRTLSGQKNTGIMGSSMGGLISHYGALKYPDIFGMAGVFSPAFWFSQKSFEYTSSHSNLNGAKMYLMIGLKEGDHAVEGFDIMAKLMKEKGYDKDQLKVMTIQNGEHNEFLWKHEFKQAILWLFN